jgi:hypothetical protein
VNRKPKHRWYQFSLKTPFVAMFVVGVVLSVGGRISYLRHRVQFHDVGAEQCIDSILDIHKRHGSPPMLSTLDETYGVEDAAKMKEMALKRQRHLKLAKSYQSAVYRPWTIVNEPTP